METFKKAIRGVDKFIINILFPTYCIGCKKKDEIICDNCISLVKNTERETIDNVYAMFDYQNNLIKKIIWDLKYHKKIILGKRLGNILYDNFIEEISDLKLYTKGSPIIVIPVPISINKNKIRGFNQAEEIASGFCQRDKEKNLKIKKDIIVKIKDTIPQAKITNRDKRLKNMKDVFSIKNTKDIKDKTIIIIDDVTTTGATISEIIKILKKNGAKKVIGIAIAH